MPTATQKKPTRLNIRVSEHQKEVLTIALESTGTYGEALRQSLTDAGLAVRRVRSQATSDDAEILHDRTARLADLSRRVP